MNTFVILDTNVLLHDPDSSGSFCQTLVLNRCGQIVMVPSVVDQRSSRRRSSSSRSVSRSVSSEDSRRRSTRRMTRERSMSDVKNRSNALF